MPFIKEKYPSFEGFANASLVDIYGSKIKDAYAKEVTNFNSVLLLNSGSGFPVETLPIEAQEFPILDAAELDVNRDGVQDIIVAGNIYQTEVETPRLDSGNGLVLIADGDGSYKPMKLNDSGLSLPGDVKSLAKLASKDGNTYLLAGKNQGLLQIMKFE